MPVQWIRAGAVIALVAAGCAAPPSPPSPPLAGIERIEHIVVIFAENRSFDHLKDYDELVAAIDKGNLPQVAFYKPQGSLNQHPSYTDVQSGDLHIADLLAKIKTSTQWASTLVIVTYDENGGFWDHVPPPKGDRWGPGTRIPAIIISPFAKRGYVDHTPYDTKSIIKFITRRFGLELLPGVRPDAGDLTAAFDFAR
jgi:phospholipase C